jgi:hypothetical protein
MMLHVFEMREVPENEEISGEFTDYCYLTERHVTMVDVGYFEHLSSGRKHALLHQQHSYTVYIP